ncbi:MAG TPA: PAS domain S-box protein [Gammaproteobacteria bacterium]|nr:PAS domain S-box protein [Gammaproteobacteria bacterium]
MVSGQIGDAVVGDALASRWGRILENSFDEIYLFAADSLNFLQVSRGALQNLGYNMQEMRQLTAVDIKPEINATEFEAMLEPLREGRQDRVVFETWHQRKDGSRYPVEVRLQFAAEETPPLYIAIILDITERREAEQAVLESERRYHALARIAPVGIFRTDVTGNCIYTNERWCQIADMRPEQALGEGWSAALHPEDRKRVFAEWYQAAEMQIPFYTECRFQRPDGSVSWLLVQATAEQNSQGEVIGYVGTITDISEQKNTESAIRHIATGVSVTTGGEFFSQLVLKIAQFFDADYAFVGLLDNKDPNLVKTYAACAHGRVVANFSYSLPGTPCSGVLKGQRTCSFRTGVQQQFPDDQLLADMGVDSYIGTPLFDSSGEPVGLIAVLDSNPMQEVVKKQPVMEIFAARAGTEFERQQIESELRIHRDHLEELVSERTRELEAANRELEAFAYSVSHDLRAPLRAIDGFSHALEEDCAEAVGEAGRDYLRRVRAASQHMGELIDDILQLSRVTRGELQWSEIDLSQQAAAVVERLQEAQPGHRVEVQVAPGMRVAGDSTLLVVVLENLIGNAWKYTGEKEQACIEIGMLEQNGERVYFVKDNGAGFDMLYSDKLFGIFQRLHRADEFEGTGIGLATVQRIVERHNGRVWADAEVGRGATFFFTLGRQNL